LGTRALAELYIILQLLLGPPMDVLVDRQHGLPAWYDPGPHPQAMAAWEGLREAAEADGLRIVIYSGYRSYAYQERLWAREMMKNPATAERYSGRPGYSEHQLGTAFDVAWPGLHVYAPDPRNKRLFAWLAENAHRYGFVLSYPLKANDSWPYDNRWMPVHTEYIYEPWHIRFVGHELAMEIHAAGYLDPWNPVLPQDFYRPWPPQLHPEEKAR